jgi:two-component system, chemotaxis family, chemotaxis protein CheY
MELVFDNLNFLIIDDSAFMRQIIRGILLSGRCRKIHEAGSGTDALDLLNTGLRPDIITTCLETPSMDGIEFAREVRHSSDERKHQVPIIMISSHSEFEVVKKAVDAGINEYLVKPISERGLFTRLKAVTIHPRPFVNSAHFIGPDRRRNSHDRYKGTDRRTFTNH